VSSSFNYLLSESHLSPAARAFGDGTQAGAIQAVNNIVKANSGETRDKTRDSDGSRFIIELPFKLKEL
jgi:hypothetical protein